MKQGQITMLKEISVLQLGGQTVCVCVYAPAYVCLSLCVYVIWEGGKEGEGKGRVDASSQKVCSLVQPWEEPVTPHTGQDQLWLCWAKHGKTTFHLGTGLYLPWKEPKS